MLLTQLRRFTTFLRVAICHQHQIEFISQAHQDTLLVGIAFKILKHKNRAQNCVLFFLDYQRDFEFKRVCFLFKFAWAYNNIIKNPPTVVGGFLDYNNV